MPNEYVVIASKTGQTLSPLFTSKIKAQENAEGWRRLKISVSVKRIKVDRRITIRRLRA